jgi:hypothetical protein
MLRLHSPFSSKKNGEMILLGKGQQYESAWSFSPENQNRIQGFAQDQQPHPWFETMRQVCHTHQNNWQSFSLMIWEHADGSQ